MINPYLQQRLFELPVRPILVETEAAALAPIAAQLEAFGFPLRAVIPSFSMVALLAVPAKLIPVINDLPGVRAVHADLESNILDIFPPLPGLSGAPGIPGQTLRVPSQKDTWWPTSESRNVVEAEDAFQEGWTGEAVKLAVIDSGIEPNHPQLVGSEWESTIMLPFREVLDENGHGSHVASTAAGKLWFSDVGIFASGVSRAPILSIKCLGRGVGTGFSSEIINAMALALERGAQVVNMSLGSKECQGSCETCPECRAVRLLTQRGVLVFVAAGNSGPDANTINCPGCTPEALTVAAIDREGKVANFSSRGGAQFPTKPDLAAPGVDIFSGTGRATLVDIGDPEAGFGAAAISGTSMATPHAAGLGALVKHRDPSITSEQFRERLRMNGAFTIETGWGVAKWSWFGRGESP